MKFVFQLVFCFLATLTLASKETYRAGVIGTTAEGDLTKYVPFIREAGKQNVDILVLPSPQSFTSFSTIESSCGIDNYDELVKTISEASKQAGLYVVAHLLEKTRCQGKYELVRSNLVFGRDGHVVSVYRKPVNPVANCTAPATEIATFTTDFGVQFGLLMDEDLVLKTSEELKVLKNFVVVGPWASDIPYLTASQFASSWAFTNEVNVVSNSGAFAGKNGAQGASDAAVLVADMNKSGADGLPLNPPVISASKLKAFQSEDLSQYIIRPLDVAASTRGYRETVCHDSFCCEFYVKAKFEETKDEMNYGLGVFSGIRSYGKNNIGARSCAIFACAGLYKRSCTVGSNNNSTNVIFEKISITANFTSDTTQFPIILTTGSQIQPNNFNFHTEDNKQITMEASNVENVWNFGVLSRDFTKDSERILNFEEEFLSFSDEMQELLDYVWIRLRILIVVVSIYFLEMM